MLRVTLAVLLLSAALSATAGPLVYRTADADTTLWLLGSVHALREDDYPLDERIESAYTDAERVVLEVNPEELDPLHLARVALPLARYEDERDLADVFTDAEYSALRRQLDTLGLDIARLRDFEPWFVALQVFALNLSKSGYASAQGVDRHFATRAIEDGKQTAGLETATEQFRMFDSLPLETQKAFLQESVGDGTAFQENMDAIVTAWRHGNEDALTALLDEEFGEDPELREALLEARNRRWVPAIEDLLAKPGDTLVIVGALHLVGDDGVIELLRERGYEVERVTASD